MQNFNLIKSALSMSAFAIALAAGANPAFAGATTPCSIDSFSSDTDGNPLRITVYCSGTENAAHTINAGGNCPVINTEQSRMWASMITSAFLAGKKLNIWWTDCTDDWSNPIRAISSIQMLK